MVAKPIWQMDFEQMLLAQPNDAWGIDVFYASEGWRVETTYPFDDVACVKNLDAILGAIDANNCDVWEGPIAVQMRELVGLLRKHADRLDCDKPKLVR